jgi:L-aminopeptidase/D-esterase-like protein
VFPPDTVGSVEIRGGAPATRETAVLDPLATVEHVDAIVLSGGSAFGLAAADGVMLALAEQGRGFPTRGGPVPIVPAAAIFDLVGPGDEKPGADEGRAALAAAYAASGPDAPPLATGRVGAGRGASVAKWRGGEHGTTGGIGSASARDGELVVGALVVVNAVGDVLEADGTPIVASQAAPDVPGFPEQAPFETSVDVVGDDGTAAGAGTNTTLAVVATNARCTKVECHLLARSAHHGLARAIHPSHTRHDGDLAFACATGTVDAHLDRLRVMVTEVTAAAVRDAVAYHRETS